MSENSREKRRYDERVNWGMSQAFIPYTKSSDGNGQLKQVYLYGCSEEEMIENTVTFLPPSLEELISFQQQEINLHYASSPYYFDSRPPTLFANGVIMTLITMDISPQVVMKHLDALSFGASMKKFVPYTHAYSLTDEWFSYDIYYAADIEFTEALVVKYPKEYAGYRPMKVGLAATGLVQGFGRHDELLDLAPRCEPSQTNGEGSIQHYPGLRPYRYFSSPTQEWRGCFSGPDHRYDC